MRFHSLGLKGFVSLVAVVLTAAALAAGSLHPATMVGQKVYKSRADRVAQVVHSDGTLNFIVQFNAMPAANYARSVTISTAHPQSMGSRFVNVKTPAVQAYVARLGEQHALFLNSAVQMLGRSLTPSFDYHYALNGMAVRLTSAEAARVRNLPGVKSVQPDRTFKPLGYTVPIPGTAANTAPSRSWIGADQVWAQPTFSTGVGNDNEGEGVVVADLDTGINAANSSFAATGPDGYGIANPLSGTYLGVCDPANTATGQPNTYQSGFPCNSKLIGAYTYTLSTGNDPDSPEDSEGHGSHTMSTAAGDFTQATLAGISYNLSGMAPHANIIAYDVCDPTDQCSESASVAAVDQAIQDYSTLLSAKSGFKGMVMNFSIGGSDDPYTDPVDQAFEAAEQVGIFVSAAGGNGGPENPPNSQTPGSQYPVQHLAPWIMTVAAGTHDGQFSSNSLENFSGGTGAPTSPLVGLGATAAFGPATIVYAGASAYTYSPQYYSYLQSNFSTLKYSQSGQTYPLPTGNPQADAAQCLYPFAVPSGQTFTTPPLPAGDIVVCDRGSVALVDKADNVKQGSAGGVVIVTTAGSSQDQVTEQYDIPGILLDRADGATLETWVNNPANASATLSAQMSGATYGSGNTVGADFVAGFSSRGPVGTYPGTPNAFDSLIKPDVMAPGVSVLATYADPCYTLTPSTCPDGLQENFTFLDGTSMATPHDTGAGALLMQLYPTWDPMAIKSALMSTAVPDANLHDQCDAANATANGCTSTEPEPPTPQSVGAGRIQVAVAARAGFVLEETGANFDADNPDNGGDPTKINLPSLGNANCQVTCTWTRTLTSVQSVSLSYSVNTNATWLSVSPTSFTLAPGGTQTLTFTAAISSVPVNQWAFTRVDFTTSSNEADGNPAPTQHFPVAVFNAQPEPKMGVTPSSLSQSVIAGGASQTQTLTLGNTGLGALNWTINTIATATSDASNAIMGRGFGQVEPRAAGNPLPIVNRPADTSGNGFPSDFFTGSGHGIYIADTFSMPVAGSITTITTFGFAQAGQSAGAVTDATQIAWYVYADANGIPAGNPEDGKNDYVWSFTAAPAASGVDTTNNNISLDLATAGTTALNLSAGKYWLIVAPTFNDTFKSDFSSEAWYWFESAAGGGSGSLIDPDNLLGAPAGQAATNWTLIGPNTQVDKNATGSVELAFELLGTLNCSSGSGSGIPGFSLSASSGTVAPNTTGTVTATFAPPVTLATGTYTGVLCVLGNDPNTPFVVVPVTESVSNPIPVLTGLSPTSATAGGAAFTLTVNGSGFVSSSVVNLNGTALVTTFVSATQLTASVPASAISSASTLNVSVTNAAPGGGTSNQESFTVQSSPSHGGGALGLLSLFSLLGLVFVSKRRD